MLSPISQLTAAAILPTMARGAARSLSSIQDSFQKLFEDSKPGTITSLHASGFSDGELSEAEAKSNLFAAIRDRILELTGASKSSLGDNLHLELSPLGNLYVLNNHPEACAIQAKLGGDTELMSLVRQWFNEAGDESLQIPMQS